MARLNALRLAEALQSRFVDTALSDHYVRDIRLEAILRSCWGDCKEEGGLVAEPWVENAAPPRPSGQSLMDLASQGSFSHELAQVLQHDLGFPSTRPLHQHQVESVLAAPVKDGQQPSIIVTAGTGYGKTECFLLPMLNHLWSRNRNEGKGVRAIILYPMNALVNDQLERLDGWLSRQERLSMCRFTGETPEDRSAAKKQGMILGAKHHRMTRYQARGWEDDQGHLLGPDFYRESPDILITNYSMLEYMLARPQDQGLFGKALQTIILDEAHLYTSTLAAEITLLLRRLRQRCGVPSGQVLTMATSATIGSGTANELAEFAATLFTRDVDSVKVIQGQAAALTLPAASPPSTGSNYVGQGSTEAFSIDGLRQNFKGEEYLVVDATQCQKLASVLQQLVSSTAVTAALTDCQDRPALLLYKALQHSPVYHEVARYFEGLRPSPYCSLNELSERIWGASSMKEQAATISLLSLLATARLDVASLPLFPHRIHLRLRPPAGFHVCLNSACCGPADKHLTPMGCVVSASTDHCPHCRAATLALVRCTNCGEWAMGGELNGTSLLPYRRRSASSNKPSRPIYLSASAAGVKIKIDPLQGTLGQGYLELAMLDQSCPSCRMGIEDMKPLQSHHGLYQSVTAETMLLEVPAIVSDRNPKTLPAEGRRLLAFSDSRQSAARLGPELRQQHEGKLLRGLLAQAVDSAATAASADTQLLESQIDTLKKTILENPHLGGSLSPVLQGLEQQVQLKQIQANSFLSWTDKLATQPNLAQIFLPEVGRRHRFKDWKGTELNEMLQHVGQPDHLIPRLAREVVLPLRRNYLGLEASGLLELIYPGLETLEPDDSLLAKIPANCRTPLRDCWPHLVAALMDTVRSEGSVTLTKWLWDQHIQIGSRKLGLSIPRVEFLGKTPKHRRRVFVSSVLQCAGADAATAANLAEGVLDGIFEQLRRLGRPASSAGAFAQGTLAWLEVREDYILDNQTTQSLRIRLPDLGLRRPPNLFRCRNSGTIWARSVLGCAPQVGAGSTLETITHAELDGWSATGRIRREYVASQVFRQGLWAEEHSAQLSSPEAKRLQDLFKGGMRNLLSCTTTMELGIDIGGLTATFLANVPPGKANYLQRAGRVGRRGDGSSIVVTLCRLQPFDQEVFHRFGDYLRRPLRKPTVFLRRERIALRHLHAWLMGEFFRHLYHPNQEVGAMAAFGRMAGFCGVEKPRRDGGFDPVVGAFAQGVDCPQWWPQLADTPIYKAYEVWLNHVKARPQEYEPVLQELLKDTPIASLTGLDQWDSRLSNAQDSLEKILTAPKDGWLRLYEELRDQQITLGKDAKYAVHKRLRALAETTVIETLADRQYLPRYGFPIGLQKLMVQVSVPKGGGPDSGFMEREEDRFRLQRSGLLALREYVPGSQVVAGGQTLTSRGLLKHWTGTQQNEPFGLEAYSATCKNQHFYYSKGSKLGACPVCGEEAGQSPRHLIFPRHGYRTALWDPPSYIIDPEVVGTVTTASQGFANSIPDLEAADFGDIVGLVASYKESGELFASNGGERESGFAICTQCGYAESEMAFGTGDQKLPRGMRQHIALDSEKGTCWKDGELHCIRNRWLAAWETTDVLLLDWTKVDPKLDLGTLASLGEALRLAGTRILQLDSRELGMMIVPQSQGDAPMLYDAVPGGAGHVLELMQKGAEWLREAHSLLYRDEDHHQNCETACFDCILSYGIQEQYGQQLRRRTACELLGKLLGVGVTCVGNG